MEKKIYNRKKKEVRKPMTHISCMAVSRKSLNRVTEYEEMQVANT
jgi:hypothetical protein